ncbi:MAG: hypothetical protein HY796_01600 [Elusimicrobia bacterium]|nr:hypothetical protein [Elusimicrobiota bacterium]
MNIFTEILQRRAASRRGGLYAVVFALSLLFSFFAAEISSAAVPAKLNYQGMLKANNVPFRGVKTMKVRITSSDGSAEYWNSGDMSVEVSTGLFSITLDVPAMNWGAVVPYFELSIGTTTLLPREPVTSSIYALWSSTAEHVVDGAITNSKMSGGAFPAITAIGALTANMDFGGFKGVNLALPTSPGDAASKTYVDDAIGDAGAAVLAATQTFTGVNTFAGWSVFSGAQFGSAAMSTFTAAGALNLASGQTVLLGRAPSSDLEAATRLYVDQVSIGTTTIADDLATEVADRTNADNALTAAVNLKAVYLDVKNDTTTIAGNLAGEMTNRISADSGLSGRLDTVASDTTTLNNSAVHLAGAENIAGVKTFTSSQTITSAAGISAPALTLAANVALSSGAAAGNGGGIAVSTNVYIIGFASATKYYGDGSGLTGISAGVGHRRQPRHRNHCTGSQTGYRGRSKDNHGRQPSDIRRRFRVPIQCKHRRYLVPRQGYSNS